MNIYQKMAKITSELGTVEKKLEVQQTKNSKYRAVAERDILDAVKPLEEKYGVYSFPVGRNIEESHILESESEYQGKITKKTTFMTRIKTVYRFVNTDEPSDYMETTVFSEGIDSQDKGSGKAMTYADKYALMKAYKISTGEDPDQNASEPETYTKKDSNSKSESGNQGDMSKKMISPYQKQVILNYPPETQAWACNHYGLLSIDEMSAEQATEIINAVNKKKKGA